MPSIDVKALRWDNWFGQDPGPAWPDWLTKKSWDKKKGLIAKATPTGIGEQLTACEKAFDKAVAARVVFHPRNLDEVEAGEERGLGFVRASTTKKLHDELKELATVAKAAVATYKKSKAPGLKATIDLCGDIETAADRLMVGCNPNTLKGQLRDVSDAAKKKINENARKQIGPTIDNLRGVPQKVIKVLAGVEQALDLLIARDASLREAQTPDPTALGELEKDWIAFRADTKNTLFTMARDMTQPIVNLHKAMQAGVALDHVTMKETEALKKLLVPYGNGDASDCAKATPEQIREKIEAVRDGANLFLPIARDVAIAT